MYYSHLAMVVPSQPEPPEIFRQLLERAVAEPDPAKFEEMLGDIAGLLGVNRDARHQAPAATVPASPQIQPSMETDTFDIFRGLPGRDVEWLEACTGIDQARQRTQEIASGQPNDYFVFHPRSRAIVFRINKENPTPNRSDLGDKSKAVRGVA